MTAKRRSRKTDQADPSAGPRKRKAVLTKAELAQFRRLLLDKQRAILGDMDGMAAEARGAGRRGDGAVRPDKLPVVDDDANDLDVTWGLLQNERDLLREIADALERIDNGTYGICLGTGLPIGKARLQARPWAKYCIEHARAIEKNHAVLQNRRADWKDPGEEEARPDDEDDEQIGFLEPEDARLAGGSGDGGES